MALWLHHAWFLWLPVVTLVIDINTDPVYRNSTDPDRDLNSSTVPDGIGHSDKQWPLVTNMDPGGGPDLKHSHGQFLFFLSFFFKSFFNHLLIYTPTTTTILPLLLPLPPTALHPLTSPQPTPHPLFWKSKPSHRELTKPGTVSWGRTKALPTASWHPIVGDGLQNASSCTRARSWSHCHWSRAGSPGVSLEFMSLHNLVQLFLWTSLLPSWPPALVHITHSPPLWMDSWD